MCNKKTSAFFFFRGVVEVEDDDCMMTVFNGIHWWRLRMLEVGVPSRNCQIALVRVSRVFLYFFKSVSLESALLSHDFLLAKIVGFDA